jgi:hypothetical protein
VSELRPFGEHGYAPGGRLPVESSRGSPAWLLLFVTMLIAGAAVGSWALRTRLRPGREESWRPGGGRGFASYRDVYEEDDGAPAGGVPAYGRGDDDGELEPRSVQYGSARRGAPAAGRGGQGGDFEVELSDRPAWDKEAAPAGPGVADYGDSDNGGRGPRAAGQPVDGML